MERGCARAYAGDRVGCGRVRAGPDRFARMSRQHASGLRKRVGDECIGVLRSGWCTVHTACVQEIEKKTIPSYGSGCGESGEGHNCAEWAWKNTVRFSDYPIPCLYFVFPLSLKQPHITPHQQAKHKAQQHTSHTWSCVWTKTPRHTTRLSDSRLTCPACRPARTG